MTTTRLPGRAEDEREFLRAMGMQIRLARVRCELSQQQLADRAGMSRNFVSAVERGGHGVDVRRLRQLARALGVELAALLPAEQPPDAAGQASARRSA
jgi:transcriptional regulator with XRE-family HTH domain